MELSKAIQARQSIRAFQDAPVPDHLIDTILNAAIRAPSEGNLQPWRFFVVKNERVKQALAIAALDQMFIAEAPVVVVVCIDLGATAPYGTRGKDLYSIQSTAAAIEHILLTVTSLELGACWVGAFKEEKVTALLDLDDRIRPVALIPMGYPAEHPPSRRRKPVKDVTVFVE